jgi:diguanylate cyclase
MDSQNNTGKTVQKSVAPTPDRTQEIAVQALERIEALGLAPVPQFYELWFRYYDGDPEIVSAINQHAGQFNEIACHEIYKRFLNEAARDTTMRKISDQIQYAMAGMIGMLSAAQANSSEYGGHLSNVSEKIGKANSIEDLGEIVSVLAEDTRKMLEKNQELELQLVSSSRQVSELRENLDNVKKEAMIDGLTGLTNRKFFDRHIGECTKEAVATGLPLVLIMLDIDHFKKFNDNFGHQTGDQVLRLVARTLTDGVKGRDIAARYGGEEFAILLPDTPLQAGIKVAESLRQNIENKEVINRASHKHLGQITLSIGIAEFYPTESIADFIGRADQALYDAKKSGRNRVVSASRPV